MTDFVLSKTTRAFLAIAALGGASAVLLGAWSSHALFDQSKEWADIAVRYQFWHALALLALSILMIHLESSRQVFSRILMIAGLFWIGGMLFFGGSLFLMALDIYQLGFLTPIGGIFYTIGWLTVFAKALRIK